MYVGCLCRTLSHTDNHIKEIACVDRISKITESLYHSTIRLRAFKRLDYWWIDCGCVHTCQMDIACQQYFYILFVFVCKIILILYSMWMMNYNIFTVEILAAVHAQQSRLPHNTGILILWGWTTADITGNKWSCNYWPWGHFKIPSFWDRTSFFTTERLVCDHGAHCTHAHIL